MKILIPIIHQSPSSDAAYRIGDIANSLNADILVQYIVPDFDTTSYLRSKIAVAIFTEAVQYYDVGVEGIVATGIPAETIEKAVVAEHIDLVYLGATSEQPEDWQSLSLELAGRVTCELQLLEDELVDLI